MKPGITQTLQSDNSQQIHTTWAAIAPYPGLESQEYNPEVDTVLICNLMSAACDANNSATADDDLARPQGDPTPEDSAAGRASSRARQRERADMSNLEIGQVLVLTLISFGYWWLLKWRASRCIRIEPNKRSTIAEASASSLLTGALDPLIKGDSRLIIPSGDGLYIRRLMRDRPKLSRQWRRILREWAGRGARIELIVTRSNDEAIAFWTEAAKEMKNLHIHFIDKAHLNPEQRTVANALDEFHPTLLLKETSDQPCEPLAMWIEWLHPTNSITASHIEFVPPAAMTDDLKERFQKYLTGLHSLLSDGPHLKTIHGETSSKMDKEQIKAEPNFDKKAA